MKLQEFRKLLLITFLLPIAALLAVSAVLYWQIHLANLAVEQVQEVDEDLKLIGQTQKLILDQETGLRGFQITGDERFLAPYRNHQEPVLNNLMRYESHAATEGNTEFLERIRGLRVAYLQWKQGFADNEIQLLRAGKADRGAESNMRGKLAMDDIRRRIGQILVAEEREREQKVTAWHNQLRITRIYLLGLALIVGLAIALYTRRQLHRVSVSFQASLLAVQERADQLFDSEQRLRTTLVSIGDGVIVTDADGRVTMLNPIASDLTGWTIDEAFGRPIEQVFDIVNEESRLPVENPVAKVKRLDRVVGLANHTILLRRDGGEINIDDSGAPIRDVDGKLVGVVMVFRDVTHEKQTQRALISNERLAVAGRLAATIAHEIHNPLDSVANIVYLLRTGSYGDEERAHLLELADQELSRVTQISRAMLSLYRESRTPVPIELRETLNDLLALMAHNIHRAQVTLKQDFPTDVTVEGYPAELRQVFTNLITNAYEAAGRGGFLHLTLTALKDGAQITLLNSGPAVSPQIQEKLFQPFVSTKGEKGTGLGLWVSRGILSKHGGSITLQSPALPDGSGVRVTVTLPAKFVADVDEPEA
ncbi:ATP-binding protein [Terriglobus tenax]|uniref:ATP-binding protein n=1 Tax=Terriglobus tenax TaxID=1111115 RepID=UPI0021DFEECA|nr:ATP-binding protein [Terriglobus tenax]